MKDNLADVLSRAGAELGVIVAHGHAPAAHRSFDCIGYTKENGRVMPETSGVVVMLVMDGEVWQKVVLPAIKDHMDMIARLPPPDYVE